MNNAVIHNNIFVSCGEVSGDLYAADFISALLARRPDMRGQVWGMMGPKALAACGGPGLCPPAEKGLLPHWSYEALKMMGIAEVIPALPRILRLRRAMVQAIMEHQPAAVVLIDSPDYHLALAAALRRAGYRGRLISLIPPTVWAWRSGRVKNLRRDFDLCLPLFSFEHRFLLEHGVRSLWMAHPLVQSLRNCSVPDELKHRLSGSRPVALMPGSRRYDIKFHLDTLLGTARILRDEGFLPVFSIAPGLSAPLAEELRQRTRGFEVWEGEGRELMAASLAVAGVSGTVAVEAMLLRRFMVVIYNLNRVTYALLKLMVRTPHISIPNYLTEAEPPDESSEKPLYPELLCSRATPEAIVTELHRYLDDPARKTEIDRRLEDARGAMGVDDAAAFWAKCVAEEMEQGQSGPLTGRKAL
ncbi:MAG: lipid-A-disaccharide synthase [Fretibacterium sp.]|nr:lipid-A-disaccharide synthase [Fretibacterium sp.]